MTGFFPSLSVKLYHFLERWLAPEFLSGSSGANNRCKLILWPHNVQCQFILAICTMLCNEWQIKTKKIDVKPTSTVSWVLKNSWGSSGLRGVWVLEPASELLSRNSRSTGKDPGTDTGTDPGRLEKDSKVMLSSTWGEQGGLGSISASVVLWASSACTHSGPSGSGESVDAVLSMVTSPGLSGLWGWGSLTKLGSEGRLSGRSEDGRAGWLATCEDEWISSLLCGVRAAFSLKLKRGEVSAVMGDEGPALDTVLEGPLLSAQKHTHTITCNILIHQSCKPQ